MHQVLSQTVCSFVSLIMAYNQPPGSPIDLNDPIVKQILDDNYDEIKNNGLQGLAAGLFVGVVLPLGLKRLGYISVPRKYAPLLAATTLFYGFFGGVTSVALSGE